MAELIRIGSPLNAAYLEACKKLALIRHQAVIIVHRLCIKRDRIRSRWEKVWLFDRIYIMDNIVSLLIFERILWWFRHFLAIPTMDSIIEQRLLREQRCSRLFLNKILNELFPVMIYQFFLHERKLYKDRILIYFLSFLDKYIEIIYPRKIIVDQWSSVQNETKKFQ